MTFRGFNLSINSTFNPLTYDELVKPLQLATDLLNQYEDALGELNTLASIWENRANLESDPIAYAQYKRYSDDLKSKRDLLLQYGLTPSSRAGLNEMRSRFASDITPIAEAYTARLKEIELQFDAMSKDNTTMFEGDATQTSLDKYLKNPNRLYKSISGALITKRVADAVANYKELYQGSGLWGTTAGGLLLERIETYGLTPLIINEIMTGTDTEHLELRNLIDNVVASTGVRSWKDNKSAVSDAYRYAFEGLNYGIGKSGPVVRDNKAYLNPYQAWKFEREKELAKRQDAMDFMSMMGGPNGPSNLVYTWKGTDVTPEADMDAKALNEKAIRLSNLQDAINNGTIQLKADGTWNIPEYITTLEYAHPTVQLAANRLLLYANSKATDSEWTPDTDPSFIALNSAFGAALAADVTHGQLRQVKTKNPLYETYLEYSKKYGTNAINDLVSYANAEVARKAKSSHAAFMHTAASNRLMSDLGTDLLYNTDTSNSKELKKKIWVVEGEGKGEAPETKAPSNGKSELQKVMDCGDNKLGYNPTTNEVVLYCPDTLKTYGISNDAFHNMPIAGMYGDEYLNLVSNLYNENISTIKLANSTRDLDDEESLALSNLLTTFFNSVAARDNSMMPEAPTTNSKISLYDLGELAGEPSEEDAMKDAIKRAKLYKQYYNLYK